MAEFEDFDIEVQDEKDTTPEHQNGQVTTAGTPASLTPTSTKAIQLAYVKNPNKGPNANGSQDVLLVSIDGGTTYTSVSRGEYAYFPGVFTTLKLDSNNNNVKYEVILWS